MNLLPFEKIFHSAAVRIPGRVVLCHRAKFLFTMMSKKAEYVFPLQTQPVLPHTLFILPAFTPYFTD